MEADSGNERVLQSIDPDLFGGDSDSDDEFLSQMEMPDEIPLNKSISTGDKNVINASDNRVIDSSKDREITKIPSVGSITSTIGRKRQRSVSPIKVKESALTPFKQINSFLIESPLKSENLNVHCTESKKGSFPGPAGLLPNVDRSILKSVNSSSQLSKKISVILSLKKKGDKSELKSEQELLDNSHFQNEPWKELLKSLNITDLTDASNPIKLMNIDWVKRKAIVMPFCRKVPLLIAVVKEAPDLICTITKPKAQTLKLIDPTGWIYAAIDSNIAQLGINLSPGTAIALQNVGLLRSKKRQPILTITFNNIVSTSFIQTPLKRPQSSQEEPDESRRDSVDPTDNFIRIKVQKYLDSSIYLKKSIQEYHEICEMKVDDSPRIIRTKFSKQNDNQMSSHSNKIFSEIQDQPFEEDDPFGQDDNDEFLLAVKNLMDF